MAVSGVFFIAQTQRALYLISGFFDTLHRASVSFPWCQFHMVLQILHFAKMAEGFYLSITRVIG